MARIHIDYFGMPGEGATVKEAKADAGRKIESLVNDIWSGPKILRERGHIIIVSRSGFDWRYQLVWPEDGRTSEKVGYESSGSAVQAALSHVAQNTWTVEVDDTEFLATFNGISADKRRELMGCFAWQRKYVEGKRLGLNDAAAHDYACARLS